ncbi:MAG: FtsX-like permease family protein [Bacteroidales bacterium]
MKFYYFISKRYLFSKKSRNIINIITLISTISIAVGAAAMVIVVSVFNGFMNLVEDTLSEFDPDLKIVPKTGKVINTDSIDYKSIIQIDGIASVYNVIEENAILRYNDKQSVSTIKGVDSTYLSGILTDSSNFVGERVLQYEDLNFGVLGIGVAYNLDVDIYNPQKSVSIHIPKRTGNVSYNPEQAFNSGYVIPVGIFRVKPEFDEKYIFVPIRLAKELLEFNEQVSHIELMLDDDANVKKIKKQLSQIIPNVVVKDKYQQQETVYKMMKSEKFVVLLILIFIVVVASFSAIGSLTMLIVEKEKDINTLSYIGATQNDIKKTFFLEGVMINSLGAAVGVVLGLIVCFLQSTFGLVKLQGAESFIIDNYPVHVVFSDVILIFVIVVIIGVVMAWIPTRKIRYK